MLKYYIFNKIGCNFVYSITTLQWLSLRADFSRKPFPALLYSYLDKTKELYTVCVISTLQF